MKKSPILALAILSTYALTSLSNLSAQEITPKNQELTETWLKLSIHSQNAGHRIHMLGVDTGDHSNAPFKAEIKIIDTLLDDLVSKGILKNERFKLSPELELEDSLINAVSEFMEKASQTYGYYTVREMMDVGTRQRLREFNENESVILNVRMPEKLLREFEVLLSKNDFHAKPPQK